MNNARLNREFAEKFKTKKTGLTSSEDEDDDKSQKSNKSGRSSFSNKSPLLSARSPREDAQRRNNMLTTMRPGQNNNSFGRRMSSEKKHQLSEEEDIDSSRRDSNRFARDKSNKSSTSPKSPRSLLSDRSERSFSPNQKFYRSNNTNNNNNNSLSRENSESNKYIRSPRSPRYNNEKDDLMTTMRRPLNDNFNKTMKRTENSETSGEFHMQKTRVATPTKLSMTQRLQNVNLSKHQPIEKRNPSINQIASKIEKDLGEEDEDYLTTHSGRTTPSKRGQRHHKFYDESPSPKSSRNHSRDDAFSEDISPRNAFKSRSNSPPQRQHQQRNFSPKDSLDVNESDNFSKSLYDKQTKSLNALLNPNKKRSSFEKEIDHDMFEKNNKKDLSKKGSLEKDPEVVETLEDSRIAEKLQKEREQKRLLRESRAKNQTETTRNIEEAIEKVENAMEDSMRFERLKEKSEQINYETKPKLDESKLFESIMEEKRKSRQMNLENRTMKTSRTRSLSSSGNFDRVLNSKYANVKPKTQTRLEIKDQRDLSNSSRLMNSSRLGDIMNDSSSIRDNTYNDWYLKKMSDAKAQLKEAQLRKRDEEEKKAQDLIDKLQKSRLVFKLWSDSKEKSLIEKRKEIKKSEEKTKEKELEKKDKKKEAEAAFNEWVKQKTEYLQQKKEEEMEKERKKQNQIRKESTKKENKKPPVPYNAWVKKKDNEIEQKLMSKTEKEREKKLKEEEKLKKKKLAEKAFLEWLDKKEEEELNKSARASMNRSLSASMTSLPPFYPTSRTIPFGR